MEWILEYLLEVKVTWSHAQKTIPWYLLGLYVKILYLKNTLITFILGYPPPHPTTIPGMKIQTYLIEFTLWGKLLQLTDSPVWALLVSSLPDRFQTILKGFRKRFFFLFFFGTGLWQLVTMLIGGIRYSVKANNQTKNKIEITRFTSIKVWSSDRVSHNIKKISAQRSSSKCKN